MRQGSLYILLALVSVLTISCDTLVDDSQTQSDENVGCYVMKEITTNTLLDINKDGISHINMLEEFHTIPGFYVPYNKAEVIKDPYDLTDEVSCYYINSQLPYPIYSDSASDVAAESIGYLPVSIHVSINNGKYFSDDIVPNSSFNPGVNITCIKVEEFGNGHLKISLDYRFSDQDIRLYYTYKLS